MRRETVGAGDRRSVQYPLASGASGIELALGQAGAKIIAHENTRLWLSTVFQRPWDEQPFAPLAKAAQPNDTFYTKGALAFGDQPVEYGYMLQSHTDGDIYMFFPEENVLVTGGVVCADRWPSDRSGGPAAGCSAWSMASTR